MSLEQRVATLEAALGLPNTAAAATHTPEPSELRSHAASLEKQLARCQYRIQHLCKAYDAQAATIERLTSELAAATKPPPPSQ